MWGWLKAKADEARIMIFLFQNIFLGGGWQMWPDVIGRKILWIDLK
jgi:hypothetical protein